MIQLKSEFSLICTFAKVNSLIFQKILNILCKGNQVWGITTPYINFKTRFHGAGDLSTALFAHHIIQKEPLKKVLENVTKEIYSFLLKNSRGPKNKIIFKAKSLSNL